jgi:glycosyltransferase involved in cell wall biosynthesis
MKRKPRLAVISPFLDKRHGTERRVVEWISRLADAFEIHVYSQHVDDLNLSKITWHRIPKLPGPHLINYLWWFFANRFARIWDCRVRGLQHDIVFSPGVNCLDPDVVSVHIVFAEYIHRNHAEMEFARNPFNSWPALLHRKLYYELIAFLERRLYTQRNLSLVLIARRTEDELRRFYGRNEAFPILYIGLDHEIFNPARRIAKRDAARKELNVTEDGFVLLLIGNDWRNKGLMVILEAMERLHDLPVRLLLVGRENATEYRDIVEEHHLADRVRFLSPRPDVQFFYAAADVYLGPSLEDTFAQPPAEAMACGLPVVVSSANGTSEIITDGVDGFILKDPADSTSLAGLIRRLYVDEEVRARIGQSATQTTKQYTWERNGDDLLKIFQGILQRKAGSPTQSGGKELCEVPGPR